jgi:hypothetical protein
MLWFARLLLCVIVLAGGYAAGVPRLPYRVNDTVAFRDDRVDLGYFDATWGYIVRYRKGVLFRHG